MFHEYTSFNQIIIISIHHTNNNEVDNNSKNVYLVFDGADDAFVEAFGAAGRLFDSVTRNLLQPIL